MSGRFLSVDPLANLQPDVTPYHYTHNNPINRIDPTGMLDGDKIEEDEERIRQQQNAEQAINEHVVKPLENAVNELVTETVNTAQVVGTAVVEGAQAVIDHPATGPTLTVMGVLGGQPELVAAGTALGVKNSIEQISNAETKRDNLNAAIQTGGTILALISPLAGEAFSAIQHIPENNLPSGTPGETPSSTYGFENVAKAFNQSAGINVPLTNGQKANVMLFGF